MRSYSRLTSNGPCPPAEHDVDDPRLEGDELISRERTKVRELREQLEKQLREAELELSVERAKIAREQAELAEWRLDLEAKARDIEGRTPAKEGGPPQTQQRRWLDKLGLGGGE